MLVSIMALWLAATPHLAVVVVEDAGQPKVADGAVKALAAALDAEEVSLGAYFKALGPGCPVEVRCWTAAPELGRVPRVLAVGLRALPGGTFTVDLKLVDRAAGQTLTRSAAVLEKSEISGWLPSAANRMIKASAEAPRSSQFPVLAPKPRESTPPPLPPLEFPPPRNSVEIQQPERPEPSPKTKPPSSKLDDADK